MTAREGRAHDVVIVVSVPAENRRGDKVPLSIRIQNEGGVSVMSGDTGYLPDCHASLVDDRTRQAVPFTTFGHNILSGDRMLQGQYARIVIEKGQSKTWTVDLASCYRLGVGTYELTVVVEINRRDAQRAFRIAVGKIVLRVTE